MNVGAKSQNANECSSAGQLRGAAQGPLRALVDLLRELAEGRCALLSSLIGRVLRRYPVSQG